MTDSWLKATLTLDQFQKIDKWIFSNSGKFDPLNSFDYCVLAKRTASTDRDVVFSPSCFPLLCDVQPEFLLIKTKEILKPTLDEIHALKWPLIYWFGDVHYFFTVFPVNDF